MDCVDLRSLEIYNDGYCWILNIIDHYTSFVWSFPLRSKEGQEVASCLRTVIELGFGPPEILHTDNGGEFNNKDLQSLCEEYNIDKINGFAYSPNEQGKVERVNQTLKRWISIQLEAEKSHRWVDFLRKKALLYNTSVVNIKNMTPCFIWSLPQRLSTSPRGQTNQ